MNCPRCNAPLEKDARFCRVCGLPVTTGMFSAPGISQPGFPVENSAPTLPTEVAPNWPQKAPQQPQWGAQMQPTQATPFSQVPLQNQQNMGAPPFQPTQFAQPPSPVFQPPLTPVPGSMQSLGGGSNAPVAAKKKKLNGPTKALIIVLVILLVLAGGWFFVARPIVHGIAQSQLDSALSSAVDQINPATVALIPHGRVQIPLFEASLNDLIARNISSSGPVSQMHMSITQTLVRLDFLVFGFSCAITGVPTVVNGALAVTNVSVEGIIGLIMSSDEMTSILNAHLLDATARLNRTILSVTLKNQEIDLLID